MAGAVYLKTYCRFNQLASGCYISLIKNPVRTWMLFRLLLYTIFSTLDKLLFLKALTGGATTQRSDIGKGHLWRWGRVVSNETGGWMPALQV
jgi:hypothetical protein